jgi:hypothetical protein
MHVCKCYATAALQAMGAAAMSSRLQLQLLSSVLAGLLGRRADALDPAPRW